MDLESIPGVGAKTATRLAELDNPERALSDGDVAAIARAPGISEGRAARIARGAIRKRHDDPGNFLGTARARELYRAALSLLQERTVTDYAERRLETLYPSGSQSRIDEVRAFAREAMARDPDPEVGDALEAVAPLETPGDLRVRDRCLATGDAETYARAQEAIPEVSVELVDDARKLSELARGYATVVVLDESFAGVDIEGDVRVSPNALENPEEVVPERVLTFFARNRERIRAAVEVHQAVERSETAERASSAERSSADRSSGQRGGSTASSGTAEPSPGPREDGGAASQAADMDAPCDLDALEDALSRLDADGTVKGDEELDRLTNAVDDIDAAVSTAESVANDRLREAIEEKDVTIEGSDLLSLVERGAGVDSLLQRELADEYAAAVEAARDHLVDALKLCDTETIARRAFPNEPTFPVEHEESVVSRLREELTAARDRRATRLKRELADDLADAREDARGLVDAALELDVELAVARFACDFECSMPEFSGEGFTIEGGRSPLLDVAYEDVEPVDYGVDGVTLLSGVNSGGKTSTLDLVALVVILAHMGLPVPGERVELERVAELHYHAKTQGTLDAGAFESTLREFGDLVTGVGDTETQSDVTAEADGGQTARKLVLVDELESITEPGASAKIMAGILEALDERGATAVFVSHLAREIQEAASTELQVDGIQAVGLEDGDLKVNRSPVTGTLARSTPELIVEKLADDEGDGAERAEFYERLLAKFGK